MITTCIFDLDGTLVNSLPAIAHFGNCALSQYNLPTHKHEQYKTFVGDGATILVHRMLGEYDNDDTFTQVKTEYDHLYSTDTTYNTEPYDGIIELLENLKKNNIKLTVLSNKPHNIATKIIDMLFGKDIFDICYGLRDNANKKPEPDSVFEICEQIGCSKDEAIIIGDTNVDIRTGKNSGISTIGVLWGFRNENELSSAGADYIVKEPKEILDIILNGKDI